MLAGDYNVLPTDLDIYPRESPGIITPFYSPRAALRINAFSRKARPILFARSIPKSQCTPSGMRAAQVPGRIVRCSTSMC